MLKGVILFASLFSLLFFLIAMSIDLYEMIVDRAAPDEICEMVDIGQGLFKVDGCKCECKINIEYVALVFIFSFGPPFISIVFFYLAVTAVGAILKKINLFSADT